MTFWCLPRNQWKVFKDFCSSIKVPIFWDGQKNKSKLRRRFCKILWPSQNIWTLTNSKFFIVFGVARWVPLTNFAWKDQKAIHAFMQKRVKWCCRRSTFLYVLPRSNHIQIFFMQNVCYSQIWSKTKKNFWWNWVFVQNSKLINSKTLQ